MNSKTIVKKDINYFIDILSKLIENEIEENIEEELEESINNILRNFNNIIDKLFTKNDEFINQNKKYNFCDKRYCFSYKNNNNFPIAKIKDKLIYINYENNHNNCIGKMIEDKDNKFELLPNLNRERECIYISGCSGSGKTFFSKNYIKKYKKIFPKRKIYIFCSKKEDNSIDDINPIRINISEEFLKKDKIDYSVFENSLVLFDDIENISTEKDIKKEVMKIANQILNLGRQNNTTIIMISHMTMNGLFTKNILSECNLVVLFPNSGSFYQYLMYLKNYLGIPMKESKLILKVDSRWLVIFRECPISFMSEHKIYMNII